MNVILQYVHLKQIVSKEINVFWFDRCNKGPQPDHPIYTPSHCNCIERTKAVFLKVFEYLTLILSKVHSTLPSASCPWLGPLQKERLYLQPHQQQS